MKRPLLERLRRGARAFKRELVLSDDLAAILNKTQANSFLLNWIQSSINADDEVRRSARRLRARARDLRDTHPYVEQALSLIANNVVGPYGPTISPQVKDPTTGELRKDVNEKIKKAWKRYALSRVTTDGKLNLVEYMHLGLKNHVNDGELFTRKWRGFKNEWALGLEPIDPDMVDENNNQPPNERGDRICMGIELDRWRRPLAYHLKAYDDLYITQNQPERVDAADILHNFRPRRLNQTRAVSWLLPVLVLLKMDESYSEAELIAAVLGSSLTGAYRQIEGAIAGEIGSGSSGEFVDAISPGTIKKLPPGWMLEQLKTDHPATAFGPFTKDISRKIAVGIGLSHPSLSGNLEAVNFSSMRGGKMDEREFYMGIQEYWTAHFLTPLYREWLKAALLTGQLQFGTYDPTPFYDVEWTCRGWTLFDPLKDAQAYDLLISKGLDSRTRILEEQGLDRETVFQQLADEQKLADQLGIDISGKAATPTAPNPEDQGEDGNEQAGRGRRARRFHPLERELVGTNGNGH